MSDEVKYESAAQIRSQNCPDKVDFEHREFRFSPFGIPNQEARIMSRSNSLCTGIASAILGVLTVGALVLPPATAQAQQKQPTSYAPVVITEGFQTTVDRMAAAKPQIIERHMKLLSERYDLRNRPAQGATMSRGKPVQGGVRVKLPAGVK